MPFSKWTNCQSDLQFTQRSFRHQNITPLSLKFSLESQLINRDTLFATVFIVVR